MINVTVGQHYRLLSCNYVKSEGAVIVCVLEEPDDKGLVKVTVIQGYGRLLPPHGFQGVLSRNVDFWAKAEDLGEIDVG